VRAIEERLKISFSVVAARTSFSYDFLEFVLQSELQLAIGQVGAGDFSEITVAKELVRIRELRCVKRIEKLRPKL
jgi:hypothetical protein